MDVVSNFSSGLFNGKTVLISGGTSGIGLAIAKGFAQSGADVIATGSSVSRLESAKNALSGTSAKVEKMDVRNLEEIRGIVGNLSSLDVLVNCQGVAKPNDEWDEETFLNVMDINLSSVMRVTREAHGLLAQSRGNVVNVASMLSYLADEAVPAYTASKTGIVGLTRALAHKYGKEGIRVNAIAPGYHKTDMTRPLWSVAESEEKIAQRAAMKRWGTVEDLVGPVLFLASDAAGFVTGMAMPVDGGYHSG